MAFAIMLFFAFEGIHAVFMLYVDLLAITDISQKNSDW